MDADRKNLWICIAFVIFAIIMAGLTWFLKYMGLEFVLGALFGFFLAAGLLGILVKDIRNLP